METEVIKLASSQGVWAVITVVLIFYILKNQEKRDTKQDIREEKYQYIIVNLTDKLNLIEDLKEDIHKIKEYTRKKYDLKEKGVL